MRAGIIGGSGYTGRELVRILLRHPGVEKISVYGRTHGLPLSNDITELSGVFDDPVRPIDSGVILKECDALFIALPHNVSMEYSPAFQNRILLIDLSADYRLDDAQVFRHSYGIDHKDASMLGKYVYGLPELYRQQIKSAGNIANPGCYPTSVILAALPLVEQNLVENPVIADSKSGHSGAGKKMTGILHAGNVSENIQPYKILGHQHISEIEQILGKSAGREISLSFTPYVMPYDRGILSAVYMKLRKSITQSELDKIYKDRYNGEPFVRLFDQSRLPTPKNCSHTNFCDICPVVNERLGLVTVISCIDNLVKGASGQAVQNMNIAMGYKETEGLDA